MVKYRIIAAISVEIEAEWQTQAVVELLKMLPDSVKEIQFRDIRELPWQEIDNEEAD